MNQSIDDKRTADEPVNFCNITEAESPAAIRETGQYGCQLSFFANPGRPTSRPGHGGRANYGRVRVVRHSEGSALREM